MTIARFPAVALGAGLALACTVTLAQDPPRPADAPPPVAVVPQPAPAMPAAPDSGRRIVKSRDGRFDGEMIGMPAPDSRFARLQIGMSIGEVVNLIGPPTDFTRHETGKRWIPFYYGNDAVRAQQRYAGEGCLTFAAGNRFGAGGDELIRIWADPSGACWKP